MTRAKKLNIIKEEHPFLYQELEKNCSEAISDIENATDDQINFLNAWVSFYLGTQSRSDLMESLLF